MNNPLSSIRNQFARGMRYQYMLCLMLGVASWLCFSQGFLAKAEEPTPPTGTLPYAAYLPIIQTENKAPPPTPPAIVDWDPQLTERGARLITAKVTAGEGYWKLVKAKWFNEQEAGGRHHILMDALDSAGQRAVNVSITVAWKDGSVKVATELKPGEEYAANYAMYDVAPSYSAQPTTDAPADRVEGMGLGSIERPTWKIHTSYGLVWQWTVASTPPLTPTVTATPVVTSTLPDLEASPTVALTATVIPTSTAVSTITPAATVPPVPTASATPKPVTTPTPTASPTPTLTPTTTPLAQAVVVGCQPDNRNSRFEGYVYRNGQPVNGDRVVFSYAADGPWVTQPAITGSSIPGFYAHIIGVGVARAGSWYAWLVDQNKQRISTMAAFTTDGEGGACNIVSINFIH